MHHRHFEMERTDAFNTVAAVVADKFWAEEFSSILLQTKFYECVFAMHICVFALFF